MTDPTNPSGWAEVDGYRIHRLVRRVRRATASETYLAYHQATRAYREVIVIPRAPGVDQATLRRSIEAQTFAAGAVRHASVYAVDDVGLTRDGRLYVATARPVGRSLGQTLADEGALDARRALQLGLAVVDAVAAAHALGVVHGRLTPEAVVLVPQQAGTPERVAVVGFGAALASGYAPGEPHPFASPERAAGGAPTLPDDVFALASVLLAMRAGGPPPVVRATGERPENAGAAAPDDLAGVLRRARAADPDRRYRTAGEFGAALREVTQAEAARVRPSPVPVPVSFPVPDAELPAAVDVTHVAVAPAAPLARPPVRAAYAAPGAERPWFRRALVAAEVGGFVVTSLVAFAVWHARAARPGVPLPRDTGGDVPRVVSAQAPSGIAGASAFATPAASAPSLAPVSPLSRAPSAAGPAVATMPASPPTSPAPPLASRDVPPSSAPSPAERADRQTDTAGVRLAAVAARGAPGETAPAAGSRAATSSAAGDVVAAVAHPADTRAPDTRAPDTRPADTRTAEAKSAAGVWAAVVEYANAVEARDLTRLGRVYPGMTEQQRRAWITFFGSVADLRTQLVVDQITISGDSALARVRGTYEYQNLQPHRAQRLPVSFKATLAREASAWRVRAVE